ncbi:chromatin associated protein KTI12 [Pyronema domesticum]|uniref:Similar to Protein kti12 acc. no. Q9P7V4 n=1 Tax=Pyronema omphalodes (strain CBS 100304) TaxID=1076935 RepID=U4KVJ4_PYROM|nr:chromatin associated protein KTI12 [Pyronema domesticum]CCX05322.1 Similar to Protein kti12; acc. no. Q9P7V4 [Pyronema omphalodes CBS 100304]
MPLIILSGYPCSGKTTRAQQILDFFQTKINSAPSDSRESRLRVHIVNTETLSINRTAYRDARAEKEARATEYSAVKRLMSKDDIVIADGLNYIKGLRYQLFCEAKAALTPSCVVHVASPADSCRQWNSERPALPEDGSFTDGSLRYPDDILENLIFRYEEPNGMARWDSPLFTVPYVDETPDLEGIWNAMVGKGVVVKANQATVLKPAAEGDYLHELGKTTQEIVGLVMEHQRNTGGAGSLPVPECGVALQLPANDLTTAQLQGVRRDYMKLHRSHVVGKARIRELFVEYFNKRFE